MGSESDSGSGRGGSSGSAATAPLKWVQEYRAAGDVSVRGDLLLLGVPTGSRSTT